MGYTHYWELNHTGDEERYQNALKDIRKLIRGFIAQDERLLAAGNGQGEPLISAEICINGRGPNAHETFYLPKTLKEAEEFGFCKTNMKPYDLVVTACLAVLAARCHGDAKVSSDGEERDWEWGAKMATDILKEYIPNPFALNSVSLLKEMDS